MRRRRKWISMWRKKKTRWNKCKSKIRKEGEGVRGGGGG